MIFIRTRCRKEVKNKPNYHARVIPYATDTEALAERIHSRCTVTPADVKAVLLTSLSDVVINVNE